MRLTEHRDTPADGPLRPWSDRPSVEFRFRDALTFLASSSLGPAGSPTGGTERVLALPAIAGRLRISGMKRVRIFGTDNELQSGSPSALDRLVERLLSPLCHFLTVRMNIPEGDAETWQLTYS